MPLDTRTIFTFPFVEQTFVNFLSVSKDLLIITLDFLHSLTLSTNCRHNLAEMGVFGTGISIKLED